MAGIDHTDVTVRQIRKSSVSYLASLDVNKAHIENHHGWTHGSDVTSRYISTFAEANDREIARAYGTDVEEDHERLAPLTWLRCNRETPRQEDYCVFCGLAVEHGAVEELEEEQHQAQTELLIIARNNPAANLSDVPGETATSTAGQTEPGSSGGKTYLKPRNAIALD